MQRKLLAAWADSCVDVVFGGPWLATSCHAESPSTSKYDTGTVPKRVRKKPVGEETVIDARLMPGAVEDGAVQRPDLGLLVHAEHEGRPLFKPGADGYAEREAALTMLERSVQGRATVEADRAYDTRDFVWDLRAMGARRTSPRTNKAGAARSMAGPRGMRAAARVNVGANGSKRCSAGSRRSRPAASCATSAGPATSSGWN